MGYSNVLAPIIVINIIYILWILYILYRVYWKKDE